MPSTAHLLSQLAGDVVVVLQVVYWLHMLTDGHMEVSRCALLEVSNTIRRGWCADVAHCCGVVLSTAVETRVADLRTHVQVTVLVDADTVDWHYRWLLVGWLVGEIFISCVVFVSALLLFLLIDSQVLSFSVGGASAHSR